MVLGAAASRGGAALPPAPSPHLATAARSPPPPPFPSSSAAASPAGRPARSRARPRSAPPLAPDDRGGGDDGDDSDGDATHATEAASAEVGGLCGAAFGEGRVGGGGERKGGGGDRSEGPRNVDGGGGVGGPGGGPARRPRARPTPAVPAPRRAASGAVASAARKAGDSRGTAARTVAAGPYAARHDEVVTALIDEALQEGEGTEGAGGASGTREGTCETHSPSVNTDTVPHPSNRSSPEGMSTEGAGTDQRAMPSLMDPPDRSGGRRGMPRSPYRATRNPSRRFRRRQRSGREDSLTSAKQMGVRMTNGQAGRSSDQVLNNALPPLLLADTRAPVMIPENFLHPDCVLHKERGSRDQKQKSSRLGFGMGNGNCIDNANGNEQTSPSAVGREETLQVLRKKLGSLGEFQHGNFGRAVEMLRSDVVALLLEEQAAREGLVPNPNGWDCEPPPKPGVVTAVETRSVLTLRLGFVSVSYGVSLRWDEISGLVTRVTLRRACRDDFLKGAGSDGAVWSCHRSNPTRPVSGTSELHPKPQKAMTPDEVPALPLEEGAMKDGDGPADVSEHLAGDDADGPRWTLVPRPSLPSWLAQLALTWASPRNFLLSAVNSSSMVPSSYLSVSVLSVRRLHGGCDHCCRPATVGGIWSSILRSSYGLSKDDGGINEDLARPHSPGRRRRRRHTTRPYVRCSF